MSKESGSAGVFSITLNDGVEMPAIGFGTSGLQLADGDIGDSVYGAVHYAIRCGYRFFDTAALYLNETHVGRAINDAISDGLVTRDDVFVCTKLWNTAHKRKSVQRACQDSVNRLGLDYIDLYLIHWPTAYEEPGGPGLDELVANPRDAEGKLRYSDTHYLETWEGMEDVVEMGLANSIGLSNFNHLMIDEILNKPGGLRRPPSVLQVECHPYLAQVKLVDYCRRHDIVLNAYCPLGAPNANWPETFDAPKVMKDDLIGRLADEYGKTPAQIILRYHVERQIVPIPKSSTPERIRENIDVFDFSLSEEHMEELLELDDGIRYCRNTAGEYIEDHKFYPFNAEY